MKIRSQARTSPTKGALRTQSTKPKNPPPKAAATKEPVAAASGGRTEPKSTLQAFGADRKAAVETLIASGAKAENPKLGLLKKIGAKLFGGSTTKSKRISANQTINTKVKNRNFRLRRLRLTTEANAPGADRVLRHTDFHTHTPTGGKAEVKDIGAVIAKGQPKRLLEQRIKNPTETTPGRVDNQFFDPKTGQPFLRSLEVSSELTTDKSGTVTARNGRDTYRQIEVLGANGKTNRRYVFDNSNKSYRLEHLGAEGEVTNTYKLSPRENYQRLLNQLSSVPPSSKPAQPATPKNPKKGIFRS